eukprot:3026928-Prymnesium_polylepis.1
MLVGCALVSGTDKPDLCRRRHGSCHRLHNDKCCAQSGQGVESVRSWIPRRKQNLPCLAHARLGAGHGILSEASKEYAGSANRLCVRADTSPVDIV